MDWYLDVLTKKYAAFDGRARRREFWMFFLFNLLIAIGLALIDAVIGIQVLSTVYVLAVLVPTIAVYVRRLHDTGRSGWWLLIALLPVIGALILLVFLLLDSNAGDNEYGPSPKAAT